MKSGSSVLRAAYKGFSLQVLDWQAIVEQNGPRVWQTAYRLLGDHTDAVDCFQETFLAALQISQAQQVRSFPALLMRLATTCAIDRLRERGRCHLRCSDLDNWEDVASEGPEPPVCIETQELGQRLRQALTQLAPLEASAFCLRYLNDMSYREIAKELKMTTSATGVLLHRAKAKLRERLEAGAIERDEIAL